jgi:hypothetical protein
MQTPAMLGTGRRAAPVLTDAGVGVGVAVLVLAASAAGVGPPWIVSPRPLDAVAVGLVGVVAGALTLATGGQVAAVAHHPSSHRPIPGPARNTSVQAYAQVSNGSVAFWTPAPVR